ncbi:MAG: phosphate acyltransferase PlsX [Parvularculaceae bacterium]|nr:phosphate acyltransferase PlsX [Parvularculaceae bacterium]
MAAELDRKSLTIAVDAMSGDKGFAEAIEGCSLAIEQGLQARLLLVGREDDLQSATSHKNLAGHPVDIVHADGIVAMDEKPARALRRCRDSSMWAAINSVKQGQTAGVVSCGNTGALMAMARLQLRMIEGVHRPAVSALWPTVNGHAVVLDVGANVEVDAEQLVEFAIMGEAYFRALTGKDRPAVGLLNVGEEDLKGNTLIRNAATILREADPEMNFIGFVEGNDISGGGIDVVVTDGFTGNIALKTAEGTARMIGAWVKEALTANLMAKAGAALMMPSLKSLRTKMDPSSVNGAPLLGLGGLVVKSHGGAEANGIASALLRTESLAAHPFLDEIASTLTKVRERAESVQVEDETSSVAAE